jgi:hypothetical protein
MNRLIYDLFYAGEITEEVAIKLLDKWSDRRDKKQF